MADITITKSLSDVKTLFNQVSEVYYFATKNLDPSAITAADIEIPVVSDGVTFQTGDPNITKIKLTTGETWTSIVEAGDPEISFQIVSVDGDIDEIFLNKKGSEETMGVTVASNTYKGYGYSIEPKKVECGLMLVSKDRESLIFMPNVEIYSSLHVEQGKPAYFQISCTPVADTNGASIYILTKSV